MAFGRTAVAPLLASAVLAAALTTRSPAAHACAAGPCATPDPVSFLPGTPDVVVTNFGLLYPASGTDWQLVCDDNFGVPPARKVRRTADGQMVAAGPNGVYLSADGCQWTMGGGELAGKILFDVAPDPMVAGRIWVLGEIQRSLFRSDDGGATFRRVYSFPPDLTLDRLVVAPSDGRRLYVFGQGRDNITPTLVSTDEGASFTGFDLAARGSVVPRTVLDFVAIAPDDPQVLYFSVLDGQGDQLWKTSDGGQSVSPILTLAEKDAFGGLAFGASSRQLYVGGTNLFYGDGKPAGRLYLSDDGGTTWQPPIVSGVRGPRYRCLATSGGKLYACGAGESTGDEFMIGVSSDGGRTWTPTTRMADITGARSCVKARCLPTELWLCKTYGQCAVGLDAGAPADSGVPADGPALDGGPDAPECVGTACVEKQGCDCRLGGARTGGGAGSTGWLGLLALLGLALRRSSARRGNRAGDKAGSAPCPGRRIWR
jgi:MYXO-CTERM domain-containing protein